MIEIKAVKHGEKIEELYELHKLVFNNKISPAVWRWKHFQNPYMQDPEAIVALDRGRVVGAVVFMPLALQAGDQTIKILQACDGMVHPGYRRMNIFYDLLAYSGSYYAQQNYQAIYAFANQYSLPGVLKVGWEKVAQIEQLVFINNPQIISRKLRIPLFAKLIGLGWGFYQRASMHRYKDTENNFFIKLNHHYHRGLKNINALYDERRAELVRTEAFLKWRFDQHPVFNYRYLTACYKNEPAGYMVITSVKQDGITCGKIVDYLVKDRNPACFLFLVEQALAEFAKDNCDLVFAWSVQENLRGKLLADYNFKSLFKFPYQKIIPDHKYFVIHVLDDTAPVAWSSTPWNLNMVFTDTN